MLDKLSISDKLTLQKMLAFLIVTVIALTLKDRPTVYFIVTVTIGYGHFLLGGLYKLSSKSKVPLMNLIFLVGLGSVLYYFFSYGSQVVARGNLLLAVVYIFAAFHAVTDDQFTGNFFKSKYTNSQIFGCLALLSLLFAVSFYRFYPKIFAPILLFAGLFFSLLYVYACLSDGLKLANYWIIFQIITVFIVIGMNLNIPFIYFFIGSYHVILFYMHYFLKIASIEKPKNLLHSKKGYLITAVLANVSIVALYISTIHFHIKGMDFLFSLNFFLIVNFLHFISSTRFYEFRAFFKGSQSLVKLK